MNMVETVIPNFCTIDLRTSSDTIGGIIAVLSYWKKVRRERGDVDEEDARMANARRREGEGAVEGEKRGERETETENMIEKGKGEYEARVSGRVNNNARRQMSIPPPLFA